MPIASRRKYPRTSHVSIIRFHVVVDLEKTHASGLSIDISKGGLGMVTDCLLVAGNILVFEDEIKINSITAKASIVRWTQEIENNRCRLGLEFAIGKYR